MSIWKLRVLILALVLFTATGCGIFPEDWSPSNWRRPDWNPSDWLSQLDPSRWYPGDWLPQLDPSNWRLARPTPTSPPGFPTATPRTAYYGGVLTMRLRSEPGTINPLSDNPDVHKITQLVFSGLMRLDQQLRPLPDLAESWSASPDGLTWTFRVRPGVMWHDGTTLTADDIVFTYRSLIDGPDVAGERYGVAQADMRKVVKDVVNPDPYTVRLVLRERFSPLLADLTVPVLPYHLLRDSPRMNLWNEAITVGTGPFRLLDRRAGDPVILEAFPQYFLGRPFLDRVAAVVAREDTAVVEALERGELLAAEIDAASAGRLATSQTVRVESYPTLGFYYVAFNLRSGHILNDRRLRQAWAYAIDKAKVVEVALGKAAEPVWSGIPSYSWAADKQLPKPAQDIAKSRELLDNAGWQQIGADGIRLKNNQRLSVELAVRQDTPERVAVAKALASQLRGVGIEARVAPSDFESTMAAARRPPFDFAALLMGWTVGDDPDDFYLFHSSQIPGPDNPNGFNYVGFENETYDRLSVEARGITDLTRRQDLYRQTQQLLADELPYYYLWSDRTYLAVNQRLLDVPDIPSPSFWDSVAKWQLKR